MSDRENDYARLGTDAEGEASDFVRGAGAGADASGSAGRSAIGPATNAADKQSICRSLARKAGGYAFAVIFIVAVWWVSAVALHSPALPTPASALSVLAANIPVLLPDFRVSAYRVVASVLIGTILAVPVALLCARSRALDGLFAPVLYLLYPVPKVVFLPVLMVFLGLADAPKIALISITVFFQVLVAVRDAVRAISPEHLDAIRSLGGSSWDELRHVVIPSTVPAVFTSLRISVGTAVAVLFFAEAIAGSTGLGYFIMQSWALVNYARMFAGIIAMAALGVILYAALDLVERRVTRWR
jgi:ABC-type nitrate/sulfonate/bicarbonate transport system permease component